MNRHLVILCVVLLTALMSMLTAAADPLDPDPTVVRTDAGYVRGEAGGGVVRFSDIP